MYCREEKFLSISERRSQPLFFSSSTTDVFSSLPPSPSPRQLHQAHAKLVVLGHSSRRSPVAHLLSRCALLPPSLLPAAYCLSLYSRLDRPSAFASNNLLRCLARGPAPRAAVLSYRAARLAGVPTNNYTYPFLLSACGKHPPLPSEGRQVHAHVVKLAFSRDLFVRNALISFYAACRDMGSAETVFEERPDVRDVVSWNSLLVGYARAGEIRVAEDLFDRMPVRDAVSWSSLMVGYVEKGVPEKGLRRFREMVERGVAVNEAALVTALSASAQLGLIECGRFVHATMERLGFRMTLGVGTALVDMYAKCGCIEISRRVFEDLPRRDVFAWNAMLCGLATHGLGKDALDLYRRFIDGGLRPTSVTFIGVLNACSRAGLVDEGRMHFRSMVQDYGIQPEMEHYGCIVDLLGRAGLVSEALELIEGMTIVPDPVLWGTLLGACKIHGLAELGETIGKKLIELEPAHDGHYVLLSGIYAKARKWEDVVKVRKLMTNRGTNKVPGWSLIEAHGEVHKFVAGDREHEQSPEIYERIGMIESRLAEAGYLPDTSQVLHDIGDEEKVLAVKQHSERLAIAFGLMVIEEGHPVRIVKNLRVCGDCHEFSKMVSKVFEREIIVRDGSRFHHFKEGNCSCLDYW
ncbi:pentatricopeptide repeat-containing protein-like [Iris pallida]|uniref:Pentatricopeptide repeat-containing protein-like n=1 Tax=Iris pallida TaxID=29817 RepID=A0AAX6FHY0_IRIPA|nr:pentatricopeptide repeat-containing protein-like [Iris pallida]